MIGDTQGNVIQPLGCLNAEGDGHVDHLGICHRREEFAVAHAIRCGVGTYARPGGFHFHVGDRHDADPGALVQQFVDLTNDAFRQDQVRLGHLDVGDIVVFTLREGFIPGLAGFLL